MATGHMRPTVEGFSRILGGSLILHIIVIALGVYLFGAPAKKIFTPVYTVDLVGPGPKTKTRKHAEPPAPAAPVEPVKQQEKPEPVKKTEPVKVKAAEPAKKALAPETVKIKEKAPEKETVSISEKIKEIAKKKEQERQEELLSSKIEELKKQKEAENKALAQRLEDIKRRIASTPEPAPAAPTEEAAPEAEAGEGGPQTATGARIGFAGKSGATSKNLQTKYREYYNIIQNRVHENWIYPKGFEYEKISVIVSIRIDRNGNLINSWLEESSGNSRFDDSLLSATKKASPFPPLPVDFEGNFLEIGLRFCPGCTD